MAFDFVIIYDAATLYFSFSTIETQGCFLVTAWNVENTLVPHLEVNFTCGAGEYYTTKFCPKSLCWMPKTKKAIYTQSERNFYAVHEVLTEKEIRVVRNGMKDSQPVFLTTACRCVPERR